MTESRATRVARTPAGPREAEALARAAHSGQRDKAGVPYIRHPEAVALKMRKFGPEAESAGWLHDVVEDTEVTLDDLRGEGFSDEVVAAVDSVTRREGEVYLDMIRRACADPLGRLVKLADNTHNSDPTRLAALSAEEASFLRKRYARARVLLLGRDPDDLGDTK